VGVSNPILAGSTCPACVWHPDAMALSLRPTGLASPAFADWLDYCVIEDAHW
jgi:hypothetical protein